MYTPDAIKPPSIFHFKCFSLVKMQAHKEAIESPDIFFEFFWHTMDVIKPGTFHFNTFHLKKTYDALFTCFAKIYKERWKFKNEIMIRSKMKTPYHHRVGISPCVELRLVQHRTCPEYRARPKWIRKVMSNFLGTVLTVVHILSSNSESKFFVNFLSSHGVHEIFPMKIKTEIHVKRYYNFSEGMQSFLIFTTILRSGVIYF